MNTDKLIQKLNKFYKVKTLADLASKLNTTQSTISGWQSRNAIGTLVDKVAEIDPKALEYIFTQVQIHNLQNSTIIGSGVCNGKTTNPKSSNLNIDKVTMNIFEEKYSKIMNDDNKINEFGIYLLQFETK